jgi:hypothetical protein
MDEACAADTSYSIRVIKDHIHILLFSFISFIIKNVATCYPIIIRLRRFI